MAEMLRIREVEQAVQTGQGQGHERGGGFARVYATFERRTGKLVSSCIAGPDDSTDEAGLQALHALRRIFLALVNKEDIKAGTRKRRRREAGEGEENDNKRQRAGNGQKVDRGSGLITREADGAEANGGDDQAGSNAVEVYRTWIYEQYRTFVTLLLHTLVSPLLKAKVASLRTLMEFVKVESIVLSKPLQCFGYDIFFRIVGAVVDDKTDMRDEIIGVLKAEFLIYQDVRYCLLRSLKVIAEKEVGGNRGKTVKTILGLLMLVTLPDHEDELTSFFVPPLGFEKSQAEDSGEAEDDAGDGLSEEDGFGGWGEDNEDGLDLDGIIKSLKADMASGEEGLKESSVGSQVKRPAVTQLWAHRRAFSEAWVACLKLDLSPTLYRTASAFVAKHVINVMVNPLQLSDFLTASYEQGGLTSLLALEGLFVLMLHHNLEYPRFYASLYKLLTPQVLYARHRPKFFRLLRLCLLSPLVPATLVAAFMKRLARLALAAPPQAGIFILALCSNLLHRHPECEALVHREATTGCLDGFDCTADDPDQALEDGLQTSLWEVATLRNHYFPSASTIARGIEVNAEDGKTPTVWDWDELSGYSYADLFTQEAKRRLKDPPLQHRKPQEPAKLFQSNDWFEGLVDLPRA